MSQDGRDVFTPTSLSNKCVCVFDTGVQLAAFDVICAQMLQDVQERLVFRTHIYIRQEILNYKPASGDLAYPSKLEMMEVCPDLSYCTCCRY